MGLKSLRVALAPLLFLPLATAPLEAAQHYLVTPIEGLDVTAKGLNTSGQVAGQLGANINDRQAMVWTPNGAGGGTASVVPINGTFLVSNVDSINSLGQVAGHGWHPNGSQAAFVWTPGSSNGTVTDLGDINFRGSEFIYHAAVGNAGSVVGYTFDFYGDNGFGYRSFRWKPTIPNGTTGSLSLLSGVGDGQAQAIGVNSIGQAIGSSQGQGVMWMPSNVVVGFFSHQLAAINQSGQVVGSVSSGGVTRAFLWTPNTNNGMTGAFLDLSDLSSGVLGASAADVNDVGTVVGTAGVTATVSHATVWTASDGILDLNQLLDNAAPGLTLTQATSVNNAGMILAFGRYQADAGNVSRAFLLTRVPEPVGVATLTLLGASLLRSDRRARRGHRLIS